MLLCRRNSAGEGRHKHHRDSHLRPVLSIPRQSNIIVGRLARIRKGITCTLFLKTCRTLRTTKQNQTRLKPRIRFRACGQLRVNRSNHRKRNDRPARIIRCNSILGTHGADLRQCEDTAREEIMPGFVPEHTLTPTGEQHYMAKLTEETVRQVRSRHEAGEGMRRIAKSLGVTVGTVWNVVHRRTWGHV